MIARKGMTLYDISTYEIARDKGDVAEPTCASDFRFILKNLVLSQ